MGNTGPQRETLAFRLRGRYELGEVPDLQVHRGAGPEGARALPRREAGSVNQVPPRDAHFHRPAGFGIGLPDVLRYHPLKATRPVNALSPGFLVDLR